MKVHILDSDALKAVSPGALTSYVRNLGWKKNEPYGEYGDIYVGEDKPEIILPRTERLGDYASVVSRLIGIFSEIADSDELSVYRDIISSDHDVIKIRSMGDINDGSVPINDGIEMVVQGRELLLAAACAIGAKQPVYRTGANRSAVDYINQVRLGQTERGSFVLTLMTPVPPILQDEDSTFIDDEPYERQVTRCLVRALGAAQLAAEKVHSGEGASAFKQAVECGVSANLCDAVANLVKHTKALEIRVNWAKTRPNQESRRRFTFSESDGKVFGEAARTFRAKAPKTDQTLYGNVYRLKRDKDEIAGQVTFKAYIDEKIQSVRAILDHEEYTKAVSAHNKKNLVVIIGDLERVKQRWHISNVKISEIDVVDDIQNELA